MSVALTGIGLWSPLGTCRESSWRTLLDAPQSLLLAASETGAFPLADATPLASDETLAEKIAIRTAREALADAGWENSQLRRKQRWGCVVGTSKGPLELYSPPDRANGASLPFSSLWPSSPQQRILQEFGFDGPALCPVSACATGLDAVLRGTHLIEQGDCDCVLAGSVDASVNDFVLHSYRRLGVLSKDRRGQPAACRPFDAERNGFLLGSGGAMFVLTRNESPWNQQAPAYGYWEKGLRYNDPVGMTQLDPSANVLTRLIGDLLVRSSCATRQIDFLHLHGTGTPANDLSEATAVSRVFGPTDKQPWATASKGAHGHALGAAGSLELAWLLLSMRDQKIPALWNLRELDERCPIRPARETMENVSLNYAIKVSLGFGGHQTACLIRRGERQA